MLDLLGLGYVSSCIFHCEKSLESFLIAVYVHGSALSTWIAAHGSAIAGITNMTWAAFLVQPQCVMLASTDLNALVCRMGTVFPAATNQIILPMLAAALRLILITVDSSAAQAIS